MPAFIETVTRSGSRLLINASAVIAVEELSGEEQTQCLVFASGIERCIMVGESAESFLKKVEENS
jgi:hypothetical protein